MALLLACVTAAICFGFNQLLLRKFGMPVILTYGPVLEEAVKTMTGFYLSVSLVALHSFFGLIEGIYDWQQRTSRRKGLVAAALSVAGHALFGFLTWYIYSWWGNIWLGMAAAMLVHMLWNAALIRINIRG